MDIKLDQYKIFREVAHELSISAAAKTLHISQSAVSQSVKTLEGQLGVRLFQRIPRGVVMTEEGKMLYEYVDSALNLINSGEDKILKFRDLIMGSLKIGVGDAISKYYLLKHLQSFHTIYPNVKFHIINRTSMDTVNLLKDGKVDIAFINMPLKDNRLTVRQCLTVNDIFVCGNKYEQYTKTPINLKEISQLPLILLEKLSNSRVYIDKYFLSKGIEISPEIELGSHDLLMDFACANLGVSCVIKEFAGEYLLDGRLKEIKLQTPIPHRSIGVAYLSDVSLSTAAQEFIKICSIK